VHGFNGVGELKAKHVSIKIELHLQHPLDVFRLPKAVIFALKGNVGRQFEARTSLSSRPI
jgi:hypothetical protein